MAKTPRDRTSIKFEDHKGLVYTLARRYMRRALAAGFPVELDDIVGELSLVFVRAGRSYKPESGYAFTTYFGTSAQNHVNKWFDRMKRETHGIATGDEPAPGFIVMSVHDMDLEGGTDPYELFAVDEAATPFDRLHAAGALNDVIRDQTLLPETRAYIGLVANPHLTSEAAIDRIERRSECVRREIRERWGVDMRAL